MAELAVAGRLGTPRLHLRSCDSTNARARALAMAGAPHGTLVTADGQTAGRGRQGRRWLAPAGSCLLCSLVLREQGAAPARLLPLMAGVALCDAIGPSTSIKWPNDIVLGNDRAKVGGILVEGRPQERWAVLGIGVNVALQVEQLPPDVRSRAASLERPPSAIEPLLSDLIAAIELRSGEPTPALLERWRALDALLGREIRWDRGNGRALGVDVEGRLLVRSSDGSEAKLDAGEVHLVSA
jgi:BirA family biotin operon repressor/biotin-[acetyl-CoA-carboxylase] ligase